MYLLYLSDPAFTDAQQHYQISEGLQIRNPPSCAANKPQHDADKVQSPLHNATVRLVRVKVGYTYVSNADESMSSLDHVETESWTPLFQAVAGWTFLETLISAVWHRSPPSHAGDRDGYRTTPPFQTS